MFCKNCGTELSDNQTVCPRCGAQNEQVLNDKKRTNAPAIAVIAVLAVILAGIIAVLGFKLASKKNAEPATQATDTTSVAGSTTEGFEDYEPQGNSYYVKDNAELLTKREREKLAAKLESVCKKYNFDIVIHTTKSFRDKTPQEYAETFYDSNGYGQNSSKDGCILVINIKTRDWYISTCGLGVTVLDDNGIKKVSDIMLPSFKDDNFYEGFVDFTDATTELLDAYNKRRAADDNTAKTTTAPAVSNQNTPFYAVFVGGYKSRSDALDEAERYKNLGYYDAAVIVSTDWSNLNKERWYCVTVGRYSTKAEAQNILPKVKYECPSAYVKYTGDYRG